MGTDGLEFGFPAGGNRESRGRLVPRDDHPGRTIPDATWSAHSEKGRGDRVGEGQPGGVSLRADG